MNDDILNIPDNPGFSVNNLFPGTGNADHNPLMPTTDDPIVDEPEDDDIDDPNPDEPSTPSGGKDDSGTPDGDDEGEGGDGTPDPLDFLNQQPSTSDEGDGEGADDNKDDIASRYFKVLTEEGLLNVSEDFEFKGNFESLKEAAEQHRAGLEQAVVQELFSRMTPELKGIVQYGLSGGQDIKEYMQLTAETVDYNAIGIDNEADQIKLLSMGYKEAGLEESKINALINLSKEAGSLKDDAEKVKTQLVARNEQVLQQKKAQIEKQAAEKAAMEEQRQQGILNHLKGLKWKNPKKLEVYNQIYKEDAFDNRLSEIKNNPAALVALADFMTYYDPEKKEFQLSKYKKTKSQVARDLKNNWEKALSGDSQSKASSRKLGGNGRKLDIDFSTGSFSV